MIWLAVCRPLRIPRSSQQLRKEKVSSPSENTATNTRAPCLRAHHPRERKSTATLGTECQAFRAQIVKSPGISTRHLQQLAFPVLALAHHHTKPQESHAQKRQRKQQQIPSPIPRRSHFHIRRSLAVTRRTLHSHPHVPQLLLIKLRIGPIYDLPTQVFQFHRVHRFRQTTRHRPHSNFNFQIRGNRASCRRLHDHIEEAGTHVRMSPQRNHDRSHALIRNNRKWRPIVRTQRGTRDEQGREQHYKLARRRSARIVKTHHCYCVQSRKFRSQPIPPRKSRAYPSAGTSSISPQPTRPKPPRPMARTRAADARRNRFPPIRESPATTPPAPAPKIQSPAAARTASEFPAKSIAANQTKSSPLSPQHSAQQALRCTAPSKSENCSAPATSQIPAAPIRTYNGPPAAPALVGCPPKFASTRQPVPATPPVRPQETKRTARPAPEPCCSHAECPQASSPAHKPG